MILLYSKEVHYKDCHHIVYKVLYNPLALHEIFVWLC